MQGYIHNFISGGGRELFIFFFVLVEHPCLPGYLDSDKRVNFDSVILILIKE